jgi:nucleotide-binding universal stress UspA family protein
MNLALDEFDGASPARLDVELVMTPYKKILFATDLSELSLAAWPHATMLAEQLGAAICATVVIEEPYALAPYDQYAALLEALRDVRPQVEQDLAEKTKDAPASVAVSNVVVEASSPARALLDLAAKEECDLIVMASHGRSGLTHLLLGSVVEKVVRLSPIPVLVVRPSSKS